MEKITWINERRKLKDLIPWLKNPRKISDEQMEHLKRSIEKFDYAAPVLISKEGTIVAGHMRTRAMILLGRGEEEVDVRVASRELTKEEFEEYAIRDNANTGSWKIEDLVGFGEDFLINLGMDDKLVREIFPKPSEPKAQMVRCPQCTHEFERKGNSI